MDKLLNMIQTFDDKLEHVTMFGYNPALVELAHHLSPTITRMTTAAVAGLVFNAKSWSEVGKTTLAHVVLDYPKKS